MIPPEERPCGGYLRMLLHRGDRIALIALEKVRYPINTAGSRSATELCARGCASGAIVPVPRTPGCDLVQREGGLVTCFWRRPGAPLAGHGTCVAVEASLGAQAGRAAAGLVQLRGSPPHRVEPERPRGCRSCGGGDPPVPISKISRDLEGCVEGAGGGTGPPE